MRGGLFFEFVLWRAVVCGERQYRPDRLYHVSADHSGKCRLRCDIDTVAKCVRKREQIDETNDLFLTSTSPTGQFSSNAATWQPVTELTMSKNTANKNFYYKDSAIGGATITAKIVGRTTGLAFSASQEMTISGDSDTPPSDAGDATDTSETATSTATTTIITRTIYISSHSNPEDISNWQDDQAFCISAGRERLTYTGVPVEFSAQYTAWQNLAGYAPTFRWSFGDGTSALGRSVSHTYVHPGDYAVILNGTENGVDAVSRTIAHVYVPDITLAATSSADLLVTNNAATEVNLGSWKLAGAFGEFAFPPDTIILASSSVVLSHTNTQIPENASGTVSLIDPSGGEVASTHFIPSSLTDATGTAAAQDAGMTIEKAEALVSILKKQRALSFARSTTTAALQNAPVPNASEAAAAGESSVSSPASSTGLWGRIARFFHL